MFRSSIFFCACVCLRDARMPPLLMSKHAFIAAMFRNMHADLCISQDSVFISNLIKRAKLHKNATQPEDRMSNVLSTNLSS